jgi:hypothetical protein
MRGMGTGLHDTQYSETSQDLLWIAGPFLIEGGLQKQPIEELFPGKTPPGRGSDSKAELSLPR